MNKLWKCPKCGRKFSRNNQSHSCNPFPVKKHFTGKKYSKELYDDLLSEMRKEVGHFRVDSIHCCIHFVTNFTFAAVYALKDKIRVSFTLNHKIENSRIRKSVQISKNRYNYNVDIEERKKIDDELMNWLKEAYEMRK